MKNKHFCFTQIQSAFCIVIIFALLSGCAQNIFLKTYGNSSTTEIAGAVTEAQNKDLIIAGQKAAGAGNSSTILIRTDKNGGIKWIQTLPAVLGIPSAVIETSTGNIVVMGFSAVSNGLDFFVLMTDSNGTLLWVKSYSGSIEPVVLAGKSILEVPGGFIIAGSVQISQSTHGFLTKIDASGNILWNRYYPIQSNRHASDIKKLPNSNYIVAGGSQSNIFLMEVDGAGTVQWYSDYSIAGGWEGGSVQVSNNKLIVAGHTGTGIQSSSPFLLVTDLSGGILWAKKYPLALNSNQSDCKVGLTGDGGYVVQGQTNPSNTFLMKIDDFGNPVWCKQFTGTQEILTDFLTYHGGVTPVLLYDDGFALVAGQLDISVNKNDICLFRTDKNGKIPCQQINLIPTPVNLVVVKQDQQVTYDIFNLTGNQQGPLVPAQIPEKAGCSQVSCVRPPDGLIAWYPFNNALYDAVGTSNASPGMGANPVYSAGQPGLAIKLDGINDYFVAPTSAPLDFGTGDFAIDFWIKIDNNSPGIMTVVDKMDTKGFTVNINNGVPELIMDDGGSSPTFSSGVNIANGNWHFVAVSVSRNNSSGGKWYIDGSFVNVFNPTVQFHTLSNNSPLYIGRKALGNTQKLKGELDELELFNTTLDYSKAQELFFSSAEGKCTNVAYAPDFAGLCSSDQQVNVSFSLCNYGYGTRTYNLLSVEGLPAHLGGCDVDGPTSYNLLSSTYIVVQQGDCGLVTVNLQRPTNLNSPFQGACYQATFQDDLGNTFWVDGGILLYNCIQIVEEDNMQATKEPPAPHVLSINTPKKITIRMNHDEGKTQRCVYRLSAKNSAGENLTNGFTINGQQSIIGKIEVESGKPISIPFEVIFNAYRPLTPVQVVFEIEDNGIFKPVSSVSFICQRANR